MEINLVLVSYGFLERLFIQYFVQKCLVEWLEIPFKVILAAGINYQYLID